MERIVEDEETGVGDGTPDGDKGQVSRFARVVDGGITAGFGGAVQVDEDCAGQFGIEEVAQPGRDGFAAGNPVFQMWQTFCEATLGFEENGEQRGNKDEPSDMVPGKGVHEGVCIRDRGVG